MYEVSFGNTRHCGVLSDPASRPDIVQDRLTFFEAFSVPQSRAVGCRVKENRP